MAEAHVPQDLGGVVDWIRGRLRRDWDAVFAIIGPPGTGKSDLAIQVLTDIQAPAPFVIRDQVAFKPSDVPHIARRQGKYRCILSDESSREGGNKRRSMSRGNVEQMEYLDTCRANNQAVCYVAPEWEHLDSAIQERCQYVVELRGRGHGVVYEVIHRGKPDNRFHYLKERFAFTFEGLITIAPGVRQEYDRFKADFLAGKLSEGRAAALALEDRMVRAIQGALPSEA